MNAKTAGFLALAVALLALAFAPGNDFQALAAVMAGLFAAAVFLARRTSSK